MIESKGKEVNTEVRYSEYLETEGWRVSEVVYTTVLKTK